MFLDGVEIKNGIAASDTEIRHYIKEAQNQLDLPLVKLKLSRYDGEKIKIEYETVERKFERIRRITGYLVGTTDRWNNAKKAEEADRVKHG